MEEKIKIMYESAPEYLLDKIWDIFESEENALNWFYSPNIALGYKTPYSYCSNKKYKDLERILCLIEYGIPL